MVPPKLGPSGVGIKAYLVDARFSKIWWARRKILRPNSWGGGVGGVRIIAPKRRGTQHGTTILIASNAVSGLLVLKFWLLRCLVFLALLMDVC